MATPLEERTASVETPRIIYILYLVGLATGVTAIVGVVMAYINRDQAPDWLRTHYEFQIRTFWIGSLYLALGCILTVIIVGVLLIMFWFVWLIIRCVKGLQYLERKEAHPNPTGWMF